MSWRLYSPESTGAAELDKRCLALYPVSLTGCLALAATIAACPVACAVPCPAQFVSRHVSFGTITTTGYLICELEGQNTLLYRGTSDKCIAQS